MTPRTVDSPLPKSGIEQDTLVNRPKPVPPNVLCDPNEDPAELCSEAEKWVACRVEATYMDGEWLADRSGAHGGSAYHCPHRVDIVKSARYVILRDLKHQLAIPIREERFERLLDEGVLNEVDS